jgi:HK97 family phage portal protein
MLLSDGRSVSIAPQAFAETTPLFQQAYFVPTTGLALEARFASYAKMYIEQVWVYAVVRKISTLIARLGTNVWDMKDAGTDSSAEAGKKIDTTSPYARLMAKPCPYLDTFSFWLWVCSTKEIYGEAYVRKLRGPDDKPSGLLPMHPSQTQIERDNEGNLLYRFMGQPNALIPERDVVVYSDYNPDNAMRGLSPLEPLRSTLMVEDSSRRAVNSWLANAGRPSMVLQTDKRLGREGRERLKTAFEQAHKGSGKAGGTLVLEDAVKATQMQMNAKDLEYVGVRQLAQTECCGAYDVPPSAVHILKDATYTNVTEQLRSIYRDSASWRIASLEQATDYFVGSEFNGQKQVKFNVAEVMRGDLELRAPAAATLVNASIAMPAEVRPWFDLGEGGPESHKLYANGTMKKLADVANPPAPPPAPAGNPALPGQSHVPPPAGPRAPRALPVGGSNHIPGPQSSRATRSRQQPALTAPATKYVRTIGGAIGGGKSLQQVVRGLLDANPDDMVYIAEATAHIIERKQTA